jgi:hypothetical protein
MFDKWETTKPVLLKDLPEILKILEDHLKTNNASAKEINENI